MAAPAPPTIVIDTPNTTPSAPPIAPPAQQASKSKPLPPSIDTTPVPSPTTVPTNQTSIFSRPNAATTTPADRAACYLCDEQNPGDFSPTTKYLEPCLLCNRWFCPIHVHTTFSGCCNINHSTYFHAMLGEAAKILKTHPSNGVSDAMSPATAAKVLEGRDLAEILIQEGIYPSLGEREKAIFATSPVDERKQRELESFRSLDAAVMNGGERGRKVEIEEKEVVGADVAV